MSGIFRRLMSRAYSVNARLPSNRVNTIRAMGCTEQEIMAITGHKTSKEIVRYTRAARQRTRAESALNKMTAGDEKNSL
jgi:hypothetical protein